MSILVSVPRQLDARKIGANGFLLILKHFKVLGGLVSSQASQASISSSQVSDTAAPGVLFIAYKFVKSFWAITFLLLVISS